MNRVLRLASVALLSIAFLGNALAQEVAYFLALEGPSAAAVELSRKSGATPAAVAAGVGRTPAQLRIAEIEAAQRDLEPAIAAAGARIVTRHSRLANGLGILAPPSALATLRALPGVTSVAPVRHYRPLLESSVPFVGAPSVWGTHATNATGRGIRVGVIDSGIDYNHADFGGGGSVDDYFNNDSRLIEIGSFPTKKVAGGFDFVGDNYDSSGEHGSPTPVPDFDPLDPSQNGHGSHVASTVAGYGVLTNGLTYTGPYDATLQPSRFTVAPGVAPEATLYAIKVFGSGGSTSGGIVVSALEWALDPNGDGNFSDHLDVVNLSLGGTFEPVSAVDIETDSIDLLTQSGVVVVVAAGNNGNVHYITGMPAAVDRAITVANSIDDGASFSTIKVTAPPVLAGDYTSTEGEFTKPLAEVGPITAAVAYVSPAGACSTIVNAAAVKGKIALIDRGTCFFVDKVRRAQQAGAIGVIMVNNTDGPPIVMGKQGDTSDITIPGVMIRQDDGDRLKSQLNNGLTVTLAAFAAVAHPELADQLENSSTRGPRLPDSHLKPDLAAPGTGIVAASVATGTGSRPLTGTSMASPHVAGAAALLKQLHPEWTPLDIKTALMNTAVPTRNERQEPYPESRTGAGRLQVNRAAALTALARADTATGEVSISFGALQLLQPYSETRTLRVFNLSSIQQVFTLSVSNTLTEPGVVLTPLVPSVTVPARGSATVSVRFDANPALFDQTGDPTTPAIANDRPRPQIFEASGQVWFHSGNQSVHVPWYSAVRALSDDHVTATTIGIPAAATAVVPLPTRGASAHRKPLASVFELGALSPTRILGADAASGDLLAIGATSDFATQGSIDTTTVYFGLVVAGYWQTPQRVFQNLRVSIDVTGDLSADFDVLNASAAGLLTEKIDDPQNMNDALIAVVKDRSRTTGAITAGSIFNVLPPSVRDTAPFHNSVAILAVPAKAIGLTANKTSFRYSANVQGTGSSDSVGWVDFDAAHPLVDATPFGIEHTPFADEGPSPKAAVNRSLAQAKGFGKNNPLRALVLHQHNAAGNQVDVVTLDLTTPDADGDARVDIDELAAFGDLTSNGANDRDGDGFNDAAEALAGTDPLDPASFLHLTAVGQAGATIRWASVAGHAYTIERAASLKGPFTPIHTGAAATAPENAFTDPEAGSGTHYYRVKVQ